MLYFSLPANGVAHREDDEFVAPADWQRITEDQYLARKGNLDFARAALIQEVAEGRIERALSDYDELVAIGVPARVASRITGHRAVVEAPRPRAMSAEQIRSKIEIAAELARLAAVESEAVEARQPDPVEGDPKAELIVEEPVERERG